MKIFFEAKEYSFFANKQKQMKSSKGIESFCQLLEFISKNYPDLLLNNNVNGNTFNGIESTKNINENENDFNFNIDMDMDLLNKNDYENMITSCLLLNMPSSKYEISSNETNNSSLLSSLTSLTSSSSSLSIPILSLHNLTFNHGIENDGGERYSFILNLIAYNLVKYVYPIILLFGIVGNFVSFLAMLNKYKQSKFHKSSYFTFSFCLMILCLADFGMLVVGCLSVYLEQIHSHVIPSMLHRSSSLLACKAFRFACYLLSSFVSYLHAYIAIDRWYAVARPIKHKQKWQKSMRQSQRHLFALFVFCFVICLPFLYFPTSLSWVLFAFHFILY